MTYDSVVKLIRSHVSAVATALVMVSCPSSVMADLDISVLVEQLHKRDAHAKARGDLPGINTDTVESPTPISNSSTTQTPKSPDKGQRLFDQAAAFDQGRGVQQDFSRAAELYLQAAELGHIEAQMNIGLMYSQGQGVRPDDREAVKWLAQASEAGNAIAQYSYALMIYEGRGERQNYGKSLEWYRRAAEQGNAKAMNNIGIMTALGYGTQEDNIEAYAWFALGTLAGDADAQNNRDLTFEVLSQDERRAAQRAAERLRSELGR